MANNENRISRLSQIFSDLALKAGEQETTKIIPNVEVIDDSPSTLPSEYIIVKDDLGYYVPALKVPGLSYSAGDKVNLLILKGTEPIAFQHGSDSSGSNGGGNQTWPAPNEIMIGATIYATLAAAISAAVSGDVIKLGEGTFTLNNDILPSGVHILGSGLSSILQLSADANGLTVNGGTVRDLTISVTMNSANNRRALISQGISVIRDIKLTGSNAGAGVVDGVYIDSGDLIMDGVWEADLDGKAIECDDINSHVFVFGGYFSSNIVNTAGELSLFGCKLAALTSGTLYGWYFDDDELLRILSKAFFDVDPATSGSVSIVMGAAHPTLGANNSAYVNDGTLTSSGRPNWFIKEGGSWVEMGGGNDLASETVAGIAEIATQTETNTGTDDARIVTPLKLKSVPLDHLKVSKLAASDGSPDPAWHVDAAGNLLTDGGYLDVDGKLLVLDADGDTYQVADVDDQITVVAGSSQIYIVSSPGITLSSGKDVYPDGDEAGLWERLVNWTFSPLEHFTGGTDEASWTGWASYTGFVTPSSISYSRSNLVVSNNSAATKAFRYRGLPGSTPVVLRARMAISQICAVGLMIDDGSNAGDGEGANNFYRVLMNQAASAGPVVHVAQSRTGGGAVTTTTSTLELDLAYYHGIQITTTGTHWSSWQAIARLFGENGGGRTMASAASLTWTPTRVGLAYSLGGGLAPLDRIAYTDWYHEATS